MLDGFDDSWWRQFVDHDNDHWFAWYNETDEEVARAEVNYSSGVSGAYPSVTKPEGGVTDIVRFEVRQDLRRRGIGTRAIQLLVIHYSTRRLAALSEESDEFWSALGWTAHLHGRGPDGHPAHYPKLFTT